MAAGIALSLTAVLAVAMAGCGGGGSGGSGGSSSSSSSSSGGTSSSSSSGGTSSSTSSSSSGTGGGVADAGSDAAEAGPEPLTDLANGLRSVTDIAIDDTRVYWAEAYVTELQLGAKIKAVPKGGGATVELADLGYYDPRDIWVDSTSVYVAGAGGCGPLVMAIPKAGGAPATLVSDAAQCAGVAVAADASGIYFTTNGQELSSVPLGGGASTTLATNVYGGYRLALDATSVYWSGALSVGKVPKAGGAPTTLATFSVDAGGIAVDAGFVFFTLPSLGTVMSVPIDGGTATQLAGGLGSPADVAVDATHAYFVDTKSGTVGRVPRAGGATFTIASGQDAPIAIAVDGATVYWANRGNGVTGSIVRAGK